MTKEELKKIVTQHKYWLEEANTGARADLHGAALRSANLHDAVLSSAVLSSADLSGADLSGAALSGAMLTRSVGYSDGGWDSRGYHFCAVIMGADIQITAGCRCFTLQEAKDHWGQINNRDALARIAVLELLLRGD